MSEQQDHEHMDEAAEETDEGVKVAVPEFVAGKDNPFASDLLDRGQRVKLLCDFARSVSDHAVIAVDGEWGTGKTAFLKMCKAYLEQQEVRVAEFNAWTESYTADPVFNLASALAAVVKKDRLANFLDKAQALVSAEKTKTVLAAVVGEFPGGEVLKAAVGPSSKNQDFPTDLISYRNAVREFQKALTEEAAEDYGPLVVLVDEVDRCLPMQVVEYLGAVHHLLAVPGVVAVLAINLEETANGLEAVYGTTYGSERYLQRFFDLRMSLGETADRDGLYALVAQLRKHLEIEVEADANSGYVDGLLSTTALATGGALRDMERVAQALRWTMAAGLDPEGSWHINNPEEYAECVRAALGLVILRHLDPEGYRQFIDEKTSPHSVMLRLRDQLSGAEPELPSAGFALTAFFDVLGGQTGGEMVTEDQFQEIAALYGFQHLRETYSHYSGLRQRVGRHLNDRTAKIVLAAVEMTTG